MSARLLSQKTGASVISMKECIEELPATAGAALTIEDLQDLLLEMAEERGMMVARSLEHSRKSVKRFPGKGELEPFTVTLRRRAAQRAD
ncbi:hypothetical protein [Mesorhizobium sp. ES1-3]|uniref:hypothetical protein n=1 Tax=Mesorhizobium sp. ES1-3 TaxID=2876628 RepID=UPI001CCE5C55|nr:hypothetical protein [Mesorhizobium sp. ES1-3]